MNELKSTYTHKNTDELMQHISESLLDLGFAPNLKGFIYVKEAIYWNCQEMCSQKTPKSKIGMCQAT
jgi:hypothetical protein